MKDNHEKIYDIILGVSFFALGFSVTIATLMSIGLCE